MAQKQVSGLQSLVCYTIDSDDSEDEEMEEDPVTIVEDIIDQLVSRVTGVGPIKEEPIDIDMYIKQEPVDYDDPSNDWMEDIVGYREPTAIKIEDDSEDSESDSDSSSTSTSDSSEEDEPVAGNVVEEEEEPPQSIKGPKTKNEMSLSDLPPVEDLNHAVREDEVVKIGVIASCVEELVVIESLVGNPALDLDTVLFLNKGGRTLGKVFDVIGPVNQPLYCVRFNSKNHIEEKGVAPGMEVFYAPKTEFTSYVFLDQLMKMKISDASWTNDEEPPPQFLDYSDDEQEREAKKQLVLDKMEKAGATEEEVRAKRAKFEHGRKRSNREQQGGGNNRGGGGAGGDNRNNQHRANNLYGAHNNPFYRRSRTYNPKENGPIRWDSAMVTPDLSTPPPQYNVPPPAPFPPQQQFIPAPPGHAPPVQRYPHLYTQRPQHFGMGPTFGAQGNSPAYGQQFQSWQQGRSWQQQQQQQYQQSQQHQHQNFQHDRRLLENISSPPPPPGT